MTRASNGPRLDGVASVVALRGVRHADHNGFVTALAARTLRRRGRAVPSAWLDVLESCRVEEAGFGFWPAGNAPAWAPRLPADADDTSIMTLELLHAGRLQEREALQLVVRTLAPHRVAYLNEPGPSWRRRGVFGTWHRTAGGTDLIDGTVNANVLALLASLGWLRLPGVAESVDMLGAAVQWAGHCALRAASVSPFYPEPCEFIDALSHAVEAGVTSLVRVLDAARRAPWSRPSTLAPERYAVCSSPYGAINWFSPELWEVRQGAFC